MAERAPYTITDETIDRIINAEPAINKVRGLIQSVQEARTKVGLKSKVVLFGSAITGQEVSDEHDIDLLFDITDEVNQDWKDSVALYTPFSEALVEALNSRSVYSTETSADMLQTFIDWGAASTCDLFKYNFYLMIGDHVEVVRRGDTTESTK